LEAVGSRKITCLGAWRWRIVGRRGPEGMVVGRAGTLHVLSFCVGGHFPPPGETWGDYVAPLSPRVRPLPLFDMHPTPTGGSRGALGCNPCGVWLSAPGDPGGAGRIDSGCLRCRLRVCVRSPHPHDCFSTSSSPCHWANPSRRSRGRLRRGSLHLWTSTVLGRL
jgi:hypothetical protein